MTTQKQSRDQGAEGFGERREAPENREPLLAVRNLRVCFHTEQGQVRPVRDVSFEMQRGEILALVGESGSGKSTIGLTLMRLVEKEGLLDSEGEVWLTDECGSSRDLMQLSEKEIERIRGNEVAMIFQEPMSSLNPIFKIGSQIAEAIRTHRNTSPKAAKSRALEMLRLLGIPNPEKCLSNYPHQLSGGMRQRVMIAMALSCEPSLLIADEPTTALDVTIQAQIVDYLKSLQERTGMSILFITHDLGLVSEIADRVLVLYAGQIVELGRVDTLFNKSLMPYTRALLASRPRLGSSDHPDYRIEAISGNVPSPLSIPSGCAFHTRCEHFKRSVCDAAEPPLENVAVEHSVRCLRWREFDSERTQ